MLWEIAALNSPHSVKVVRQGKKWQRLENTIAEAKECVDQEVGGSTSIVLIGVKCRANRGLVDNLVGGFIPNAKCHAVADVLGDTDPVAQGFV